MHVKLASGLVDGWNTLKDKEPNHEKFERMCAERYSQPFLSDFIVTELDTIKDLKLKMQVIASNSRKNLKLCDGIGITWLTKNKYTHWLAVIIPGLAEDYDKAVLVSTKAAEKYTAELIAQYLRDVK